MLIRFVQVPSAVLRDAWSGYKMQSRSLGLSCHQQQQQQQKSLRSVSRLAKIFGNVLLQLYWLLERRLFMIHK